MRLCALLVFGHALAGCGGGGGGGSAPAPAPENPPAPALKLGFATVASELVSPTFLASPPGGADIYVVEQPGRIRKLVNGAPQALVLDISPRVSYSGERGMLSLAFDPQFANNGYVFVYFTDTTGDIVIERFTFPVPGVQLPSGSEATAVRVLTIPHRAFANHNCGQLRFGIDGMLYIGTGDGGGGGDPLGSGQNLDTLLGKILRIDVRSLPYKIPPDNPFAGQPGKRPEIWAYGLRNPWRFSFDNATTVSTLPMSAKAAAKKSTWSLPAHPASTMAGISGKAAFATRQARDARPLASRCRSSSTTTATVARSPAGTCIAVPRFRKSSDVTSTPTFAVAGCEAFSSRAAPQPSRSTGT
jgi:hypothetical protein